MDNDHSGALVRDMSTLYLFRCASAICKWPNAAGLDVAFSILANDHIVPELVARIENT